MANAYWKNIRTGLYFIFENNFEKATEFFKVAILEDQKHSLGYFFNAINWMCRGDFCNAILNFNVFFRHFPDIFDCHDRFLRTAKLFWGVAHLKLSSSKQEIRKILTEKDYNWLKKKCDENALDFEKYFENEMSFYADFLKNVEKKTSFFNQMPIIRDMGKIEDLNYYTFFTKEQSESIEERDDVYHLKCESPKEEKSEDDIDDLKCESPKEEKSEDDIIHFSF